MGVQGLWELLAPVGRRVSVETLAGKKVAIDASIWMIQFMKAMRDERGEMVRNAHILGFFRRICKLLFLRTKPVFVFDGGTPALKRRTVIARRRQRENAQAKIRKTAEKLLLNHLKAIRLKELANDLENQRQQNQRQENGDKGKKVSVELSGVAGSSSGANEPVSKNYNQEAIDAMLAASIEAEEDEGFIGGASTSSAGVAVEDEDEDDDDDDDDDEEMLLPTLQGNVDPAVLAALPPSMQLDLLVQMRERLMAENRQKYQKVKKAPARFSELQIEAYLKTVAFRREIDEVRKAAGGKGIGGVRTSRIASEANREFIFSSSFTGNRQALASAGVEGNGNPQSNIPTKNPSVVLVGSGVSANKSNSAKGSVDDERERIFTEDVETYLDERGRVRVSKVRALGIRMTRDLQRNLDLMKEIEQQRGPVTNSDDKTNHDKMTAGPSELSKNPKLLETMSQGNDGSVCSNKMNQQYVPVNGTSIEVSFDDDDGETFVDRYDDVFAHIVAGEPLVSFTADNTSSAKQPDDPSDCEREEGVPERVEVERPLADRIITDESDMEWEDGPSDNPEQSSACEVKYRETASKGALLEEVDFQEAIKRSVEDMTCQKHVDASSALEELKDNKKMASESASFVPEYLDKDRTLPKLPSDIIVPPNKSSLEVLSGIVDEADNMETDLLEAIRRSMEDMRGQKDINASSALEELKDDKKLASKYSSFVPECFEEDRTASNLPSEGIFRPNKSSFEVLPGVGAELDNMAEMMINKGGNSPLIQLETSNLSVGVQIEKPHERHMKCQLELSSRGASDDRNSQEESEHMHSVDRTEQNRIDVSNSPDANLADMQCACKPLVDHHVIERTEAKEAAVNGSESDFSVVPKFTEERYIYEQREDTVDKLDLMAMSKEQIETSKASLEEEMINLAKERTNLGDEQRRLERNAESVSSEMFAECQELLQMFGLPYIIAPMEAEAQCAFMELENLVDGVVTDDSDVFLFGARSVYKNIFDDRKYVETYFMKDIEAELGLTREKLIRMAMLLGSDYTEGISGIGIVNAVEVINAFPEEDGLHKFREWIESPDPTILGKVDIQAVSGTRKRGSNGNGEGASTASEGAVNSDDDNQRLKQIFMDKHRNVSKNWHIPSTFPSDAVISAYATPQVDKSKEPFLWGKPDLILLRKLCWEKFGWGTQKADELLQPVLKEYNKHETQLRLEAFYTFNERFAKIRSKRMSKAVKGIVENRSLELMDDNELDASKGRKRRKVRKKEVEDDRARERLTTREELDTKEGCSKQNTKEASSVQGRGRGKGRGQSFGSGSKKNSALEFSGTSSGDGNNWTDVHEVHTGQHEPRRSKRARNAVKYTMNEDEIEEPRMTEDYAKADEDGKLSDDVETLVDAAIMDTSRSNDQESELRLYENVDLGGGFCTDEAELDLAPGQLGCSQNDETTLEAGLSEDYLKMGGGFCLDEEGIAKEPGNSTCSPTRMVDLDAGATEELNEPANREETEASVNIEEAGDTNITISPMLAVSQNIAEDDTETRPLSFLSAMPNLRRKRRKT